MEQVAAELAAVVVKLASIIERQAAKATDPVDWLQAEGPLLPRQAPGYWVDPAAHTAASALARQFAGHSGWEALDQQPAHAAHGSVWEAWPSTPSDIFDKVNDYFGEHSTEDAAGGTLPVRPPQQQVPEPAPAAAKQSAAGVGDGLQEYDPWLGAAQAAPEGRSALPREALKPGGDAWAAWRGREAPQRPARRAARHRRAAPPGPAGDAAHAAKRVEEYCIFSEVGSEGIEPGGSAGSSDAASTRSEPAGKLAEETREQQGVQLPEPSEQDQRSWEKWRRSSCPDRWSDASGDLEKEAAAEPPSAPYGTQLWAVDVLHRADALEGEELGNYLIGTLDRQIPDNDEGVFEQMSEGLEKLRDQRRITITLLHQLNDRIT